MLNDDVIRRGGGSPQARAADEAGYGGSSRAIDDDTCQDCGRLVEECQCPDKLANV